MAVFLFFFLFYLLYFYENINLLQDYIPNFLVSVWLQDATNCFLYMQQKAKHLYISKINKLEMV